MTIPQPFHPDASHVHPEYRDGWNAAIEAMQECEQAHGWQPIETAPKDGREIILRKGARVGAACWCKWPDQYDPDGCIIEEGGEDWTIGNDGDDWSDEKAPTHWQPLPTAPNQEVKP